jgi:hypothetical protein
MDICQEQIEMPNTLELWDQRNLNKKTTLASTTLEIKLSTRQQLVELKIRQEFSSRD